LEILVFDRSWSTAAWRRRIDPGPTSAGGIMSKPNAQQPDLAADRQIIDTRLGPVEYARSGEGSPVVVLHGSPGGIDAAALMAGFLPRDTISAILLSRPGYLGTELGERRTIDEQADLIAALLDALDVPSAGVLSWSGGGPCGYRLAVRHPERVRAVVAFAALSRSYHAPATSLSDRLMFTTSAGQWLMRVLATHRPADFVAGTMRTESSLSGDALKARVAEILADPAKLEFVLALGPTASQTKERRAGFDNDLAQFASIESLELHRIAAPTLVVQGSADTDVTPDDSGYAATTIPGAQRLDLDGGSHLALYTHPDAADAQRQVVEHLLG
jgi:pimeloyl-ACP methyl ester carboxylesterase